MFIQPQNRHRYELNFAKKNEKKTFSAQILSIFQNYTKFMQTQQKTELDDGLRYDQ
jgi:hypothetical protein